MSTRRRALGLIPARGGSKGLPGKNIRPLAGKPLIAWTVEAALASARLDRVIVSSDDPGILAAATAAGAEAPFVRPAALADDTATSIAVARHAMAWVEAEAGGGAYDYLVLLQPTSPLRTGADIDACIALCEDSGADSVISVVESAKSPYWMFSRDQDGKLTGLLPRPNPSGRRQDVPPAFMPNGAVYVTRWDVLKAAEGFIMDDTRGLVMPPERSVDIDSLVDFHLTEVLLAMAGTDTATGSIRP